MKKQRTNLLLLALGIMGGASYSMLIWYLDYGSRRPSILTHFIVDWSVPGVLGATIAAMTGLFLNQKRLNKELSNENIRLKSRMLTNALASYILHEIGNPIHNLSAVLDESSGKKLDEQKTAIIERNLNRLSGVTDQLKQIHLLSEEINFNEPLKFDGWIQEFIAARVLPEMKKKNLRYELHIDPAIILKMHPLLMEQCLTLLFDNAFRALKNSSEGLIVLDCARSSEGQGFAKITLRNSGDLFPSEVLEAGGRKMIRNPHGAGLGLVLVRDMVKQVDGELNLTNQDGMATVSLFIPEQVKP